MICAGTSCLLQYVQVDKAALKMSLYLLSRHFGPQIWKQHVILFHLHWLRQVNSVSFWTRLATPCLAPASLRNVGGVTVRWSIWRANTGSAYLRKEHISRHFMDGSLSVPGSLSFVTAEQHFQVGT